MQFQIVNVTPDLARQWLDQNGKNRRYSQANAKKIAKAITDGQWSLNGETICFDENGRLLDGQHRLHAVVIAGVSVPMSVATGVSDPNAFQTYDSVQRTRGADQIAEMKGVENSRKVTAAARVVINWEKSSSIEEFHRKIMASPADGPHEVSDKAVEIQQEFEACRKMVGDGILKMTRVGAGLLGLVVVLNRIDPVATQSFFRKVSTGVVDSPNDPALIYRDRLLSGNGIARNERRWRVAAMAMTVKAWNANKAGRTIKILRFRQDGDTPETFPAPIRGGLE